MGIAPNQPQTYMGNQLQRTQGKGRQAAPVRHPGNETIPLKRPVKVALSLPAAEHSTQQ